MTWCIVVLTECTLGAEVGQQLRDLVLDVMSCEPEGALDHVHLIGLGEQRIVNARHYLVLDVHPKGLWRKRHVELVGWLVVGSFNFV